MFCSKCGNQMPDTAKFCNKCGQAVQERDKGEEKPVGKKKSKIIVRIVLVLAIMVVIAAIVIVRLLCVEKEYDEQGNLQYRTI